MIVISEFPILEVLFVSANRGKIEILVVVCNANQSFVPNTETDGVTRLVVTRLRGEYKCVIHFHRL